MGTPPPNRPPPKVPMSLPCPHEKECPFCHNRYGLSGKYDWVKDVMNWKCPGQWWGVWSGCGERWSEYQPTWGAVIYTGREKVVHDRIDELERKKG